MTNSETTETVLVDATAKAGAHDFVLRGDSAARGRKLGKARRVQAWRAQADMPVEGPAWIVSYYYSEDAGKPAVVFIVSGIEDHIRVPYGDWLVRASGGYVTVMTDGDFNAFYTSAPPPAEGEAAEGEAAKDWPEIGQRILFGINARSTIMYSGRVAMKLASGKVFLAERDGQYDRLYRIEHDNWLGLVDVPGAPE